MSLYLKYRPQSLDQIKGNGDIISMVEKMTSNLKTCPHSFLLTGPTGCGKTTLGRIIADRLGCKGQDYKEVDSADFRGIDTIREIRRNSQYKSLESPCRVWLLDEVHKLSNDAQNALLKILEDTPAHVYFILCTTDPQKLIDTIKGRCQHFQMQTLSDEQLFGLLRRVVREEGQTLEKEVYELIIQNSLGHPRNALQSLEQVLSVEPERRLEIARLTEAKQAEIIQLCRALMKRESWKSIKGILAGLKEQEPETIRRAVLGYCQSVLFKEDNTIAGLIMEFFMDPTYNSGFAQIVFNCYSITKSK
jgi:DNA polymerase III subunit gamma/tau